MTINSRKFDGNIHRSWKADLIEETDLLWVFLGEFENEVDHVHLGKIQQGTISYEYYWKNQWFNVFRFHEPDGKLRNYYCNVNEPPTFADQTLNYVDLEIDVLVWKDFSVEVLDMDEFEQSSEKFDFSPEIRRKAKASLSEILKMVESRHFPFDQLT